MRSFGRLILFVSLLAIPLAPVNFAHAASLTISVANVSSDSTAIPALVWPAPSIPEPDTASSIRRSTIPRLVPQPLPAQTVPHIVSSRTCALGKVDAPECRIRWTPLLAQSLALLALQHGETFATSPAARHNLTTGSFFSDWTASVSGQHLSRWQNGQSFAHNYLSQPMTSAMAAFVFLQNDPRGRGLTFHNDRPYWMSRLRALGFAAAWNAQYQAGPFSRASLANSPASHVALVDYIAAPVLGTAMSVTEDVLDRQLVWRLEARTNNKAALLAMSLLNPSRTVANALRARAPWYRDSRETRIAHFVFPFQIVPRDPPSQQGE